MLKQSFHMFGLKASLFLQPTFNLVYSHLFTLHVFVLRLMFIMRNLTKSQKCDISVSKNGKFLFQKESWQIKLHLFCVMVMYLLLMYVYFTLGRNAKNPYLGVHTFKMPHCYKHHPKSNTVARINL